jgi:hypothetical protein
VTNVGNDPEEGDFLFRVALQIAAIFPFPKTANGERLKLAAATIEA